MRGHAEEGRRPCVSSGAAAAPVGPAVERRVSRVRQLSPWARTHARTGPCREPDESSPSYFLKIRLGLSVLLVPRAERKCRPAPTDVFQLAFFTYYTVAMGGVNPSGPVPIDSVFIYRPDKRLEVWRFLFYMVLHAG